MNNLKRTYTQRINGNYILETTEQLIYRPVKRIKYNTQPSKQVIKRPKHKMTNHQKGKEFEDKIARRLRSLDIEITHSRVGKDQGVDMIGNYQGIDIIIQCKANQSSLITGPQIERFEGCVSRRAAKNENVFGLFIAKEGYTTPAKQKARSSRYQITLSTEDNFESQVQQTIKAIKEKQKWEENQKIVNQITQVQQQQKRDREQSGITIIGSNVKIEKYKTSFHYHDHRK